MKLLVTGIAGFIGHATAKKALSLGHEVIGIDNINTYYDPQLKIDRLKDLGLKEVDSKNGKISFQKIDIADDVNFKKLFEDNSFEAVIHLAAQAGVRYSIENPQAYIKSNADGFLNILEGCRQNKVDHLIYASSSSVYGLNKKVPFSTKDPVDHPVSLYAATKRANELMAHTYSHLYGVATTGLRFFTVYGPWGRPDMAPFIFTKSILNGDPIKVFNNGDMKRDFTYVDDIVDVQLKLLDHIPSPSSDSDSPDKSIGPFKIFNIGNSKPVDLMKFIETVEKETGVEAIKEMAPIQPGDVKITFADVEELYQVTGLRPKVAL